MKAAYEEKFLVNMNTIEEGLNFIVPSEWYTSPKTGGKTSNDSIST